MAASLTLSAADMAVARAATAARAGQRLVAGTRSLEVNGRAAELWRNLGDAA
ncbi:hypothetical protein ACMV_P1_00440 (plasmid) [Acidiphilium multivorum AIU301]|uniref:Uncharacterized protein n=1 Tax=Acidiphilium multivorum (strain DSM 11245 / JCM 8867 / NBRC 100883 / AIU 301) TaxID=926570 RepID=F0J6X3_ACIMA|nr:hypothetical protein ACMV_P1_00440 [Acidiphilium multivorum AIU301]